MIAPRILIPFIILFAYATILTAQVGIGTTSPQATLHVAGTLKVDKNLEITPQVTPTGTATGQLAVIGDMLYMYDLTRGKWLSVESTALQFGRNGNINAAVLEFGGGMVSGSSGPRMPFDGTIIAITANSSGGAATKQFQVRVRNGTTTQSTTSFNLSANTYTDTSVNQNFSAGNYINVRSRNNGDGNVTNPGVVVWVKWRK